MRWVIIWRGVLIYVKLHIKQMESVGLCCAGSRDELNRRVLRSETCEHLRKGRRAYRVHRVHASVYLCDHHGNKGHAGRIEKKGITNTRVYSRSPTSTEALL